MTLRRVQTLTEENRRLREALEKIVERTADLRWRDEKGRAEASFYAFSIAEDALAGTPEGQPDYLKTNVPNGLMTNPGDENY